MSIIVRMRMFKKPICSERPLVDFSFNEKALFMLAHRCAIALMLIGLLGICGWLFDPEFLTRISPQFQLMKFNTALGFLLTGAGLRYRELSLSRIVIGITISALGAFTLTEYLWHTDFGIDQFLITDKSNDSNLPGRMSSITATGFLCSGLAIILINCPKIEFRNIQEILAICIGSVGLVSVLGFLMPAKELYQLPGYSSVSLYSGIAFLVLSIGILSTIPESLMEILCKTWRSHRQIWLGFVLLQSLLVVSGFFSMSHSYVRNQNSLAESTSMILFVSSVGGIILAFSIIKKTVSIILRNESELFMKQLSLQQSQLNFDRAQEVGQIGWWRLDTTNNILTWSCENYRIFGVPRGTPLSYDKFLELVHPEDRQYVKNQWMTALRGYPYDIEHRIVAEGRIKWVREKAYLEVDESGMLQGGFGITQDITKRKQFEIDLQTAQASLNIAVEAAQMGTWDLDLTRDFSGHRSLRHDQIFGYQTPQAVWGVEIARRHVLAEDRETFDAAFAEAKETGILKFEVRIHWPDGSVHWMAVRGLFYFDESGNPVRGAGVNYDITERRQAEVALIEADRRKNEFLAMLGHELRNPLMPIRNIAEALQKPNISQEKIKLCIEILDRNVQHIMHLVDDLLDVSRITQGLIKINKQRLELTCLAGDVVKSFQGLIDAKKQDITLNLPKQPVFVNGDAIRVTQVLTNLLNNSIKYTGEGGRIELAVRAEGQAAFIHIKDNGIGIEADLLPKVFDLFTQSEDNLSQSEGGLGIGLTLAKKLVELHGGEINAQSKGHNQGSEFIVRLPVFTDQAVSSKLAKPQPESGEDADSLRILLIDDNPDVVSSLALWLELAGHQIKSASNGAEGLYIAESFHPEIVLLDIGLPDMDGYEAARQIRSLPDGGKMLVIAMSGYAPVPEQSNKEKPNIDHYLNKPPKLSQLRQLINDYYWSAKTNPGGAPSDAISS